MKVEIIYESASSDGYNRSGDGRLYDNKTKAMNASKERHGAYSCGPIEHLAIKDENGRYFLLKSKNPVSLQGTPQAREDLAVAAFNKLSKEEREALGVTEPRKSIAKDTSLPWPVMLIG